MAKFLDEEIKSLSDLFSPKYLLKFLISKGNECYIPEFDLIFIINNINLFFETEQISIVISSQIISLINMNNKIIDILLNKCNIFELFLSILNNENYKNELKKRIIELLKNILKINNNTIEYTLQILIIS